MIKMKDSGIEWIGVVPKNWEIERLQWHLYEIVEKNDPIQTTQVLSLTNKKGVIPYEEKGNQGNTAKENYDGYKIAYPDTIVANSMNILIGSVGYSKLYGCVSPVYYVFKEKNNNDLRFINYIMQTSQFQCELRKCANGILEIRLRVSSSDILKQKCAFPNLQTQTLIADYLDEKCAKIDKIIEKQQAVIEKLKEYKLSVITEAVTPKSHWQAGHLGYLSSFKNGLNYNGASEEKEIKFLGVGDFKQHFLLNREDMFSTLKFNGEIPDDLLLKNGDIVFVRSNGSKELVGRSVLIDNVDYPLTYSGFCIRMRNLRKDLVSNEFLMYLFWSNDFRQCLNRDSRGSNINNLNQELLSKLRVVFPDLDEQKKIVDILSSKCAEIENIIIQKENIVEKLTEYKKSLIYEVVTGKKVV